MNRAAASMAPPNGGFARGLIGVAPTLPSPAGVFYRSSTNSRSADRFPFSSVSLFGAAIFWTSLNPAALRRDEQAFDDR